MQRATSGPINSTVPNYQDLYELLLAMAERARKTKPPVNLDEFDLPPDATPPSIFDWDVPPDA